jgi:hypothetical protein
LVYYSPTLPSLAIIFRISFCINICKLGQSYIGARRFTWKGYLVLSSRLPLLLNVSIPMQQHALQIRYPQISTKLGTARNRLREFRQNILNSFRKSQKNTIEIIPSPFRGCQLECSQRLSSAPPVLLFPFQNSVADSFSSIMDGATERMFRKSQLSQAQPANVSAIFVHAGAGYHSTTNEHIHLGACDRYFDRPKWLIALNWPKRKMAY